MEKRIQDAIRAAELEGPIGYYTLLKSQLSLVDDAFSKGDRGRIWQDVMVLFNLISPYVTTGKGRILKQLSDLGDIIDDNEFIREAEQLYGKIIKIIEEKTGERQQW